MLIEPDKEPKTDKLSILAEAIRFVRTVQVENRQLQQLNKFLEVGGRRRRRRRRPCMAAATPPDSRSVMPACRLAWAWAWAHGTHSRVAAAAGFCGAAASDRRQCDLPPTPTRSACWHACQLPAPHPVHNPCMRGSSWLACVRWLPGLQEKAGQVEKERSQMMFQMYQGGMMAPAMMTQGGGECASRRGGACGVHAPPSIGVGGGAAGWGVRLSAGLLGGRGCARLRWLQLPDLAVTGQALIWRALSLAPGLQAA